MISCVFVFMIAASIVYAIFTGDTATVSQSLTQGATQAVELLISMCGMLCLWSGVMQIAKESGLTDKLSKLFAKPLSLLFNDVAVDSEAFSYICMNVSANLLGLSNAATPLGINAMKELKKGVDSDTASDSMVIFVVMNTASIQLVPTTVAVLRSSYNSESPFDIIFCVLISSAVALAVGLCLAKILCKARSKKWSF